MTSRTARSEAVCRVQQQQQLEPAAATAVFGDYGKAFKIAFKC
jgi:hypothetical protein